MPPTKTVFIFEDLTMGEIIALMNDSFCLNGRRKYVVFGKDLRAMWDELSTEASDYNRVCKLIDMETTEVEISDKFVKDVMAHLNSEKVTEEAVRCKLEDYFPEEWLRLARTKMDIEEEFETFKQQLFYYLSKNVGDGIVLKQRPPAPSKKKKARRK